MKSESALCYSLLSPNSFPATKTSEEWSMNWARISIWSVERFQSLTGIPSKSQSFLFEHGHRYNLASSLLDIWEGMFATVNRICIVCFSCVQAYKESVLEPMLQGTDKTPALISDYKEYHTDATVKFLVRMSEEKLAQAEAVGLHKVFKLQSSLTCNSMVNC